MTNTVAHRLQSWFTTRMTTFSPRYPARETISDKAERLRAQGRYREAVNSFPPNFWVGVVMGDHGDHTAYAVSEEMAPTMLDEGYARVGCDCRAGRRRRLCSHMLLAERLRKGEDA